MNDTESQRKEIEEQLAIIRRNIYALADKSSLESLERRETYKSRGVYSSKQRSKQHTVAEICDESIDKGDIDSAVLAILRHIEDFNDQKADSSSLAPKVQRKDVEKAFDRLISINNDLLSSKYNELQCEFERHLQQISDRLKSLSQDTLFKIDNMNSRLDTVENCLSSFKIHGDKKVAKRNMRIDAETLTKT